MKVTIYTDGSARGNPDGPGGYGTILSYIDSKGTEHLREYSQGYKKTTNNRMELTAAIEGLSALKEPCAVTLYSDSKYLVDAFLLGWVEGWRNAGWRRGREELKNPDLWEKLYDLTKIHKVDFIWVKGHAGHEYNERCDKLATAFADSFE